MSTNPIHNDSPKSGPPGAGAGVTPEERNGLTTEQAEELYKTVGFNELPEITVSLWWVLLMQFTGTMPYMLELACIIALAVEDFVDFAIIFAMLVANGFLGFHEQLKAAASLVSVFHSIG